MQILLNLLPTEKKEALSRSFYFRFFTWQTVLMLMLEIFYISILFSISIILSREVQSVEESISTYSVSDMNVKKITEYQTIFKKANIAAQSLHRYTENHLHWTNLFVLIDKRTPERVVITDVATEDYTITLSGQAPTRDDFLLFEDNLKSDPCVDDVKVPLSNLFSKTEVEFQFQFTLKKECLRFDPRLYEKN